MGLRSIRFRIAMHYFRKQGNGHVQWIEYALGFPRELLGRQHNPDSANKRRRDEFAEHPRRKGHERLGYCRYFELFDSRTEGLRRYDPDALIPIAGFLLFQNRSGWRTIDFFNQIFPRRLHAMPHGMAVFDF